jgi:hypothetical protein
MLFAAIITAPLVLTPATSPAIEHYQTTACPKESAWGRDQQRMMQRLLGLSNIA